MRDDRGARLVIGMVALAIGLVLVSFVPVTRIDCDRAGTETRCVVETALLGVHVLEREEIRGVVEARVQDEVIRQEERNVTQYHLVISGRSGSTAPRGLRRENPADLREVAARLNDVVSGAAPGPARERSYNAFANAIGAGMILIGLSITAGSARRRSRPSSS